MLEEEVCGALEADEWQGAGRGAALSEEAALEI